MSDADAEVYFKDGYRKDAILKAIEIVKQNGRSAELVICRDIPGYHTGGEDCFCDPKIITIDPEEIKD
jgi:hypothetical protein